MLSSSCDKYYPTMKCEMCPKPVTNIVYGLCDRCVAIWTSQRNVEDLKVTMDHVNAIVVQMVQDKNYYDDMDHTFRQYIEQQKRQRMNKLDFFQNMREHFQASLLMTPKQTVCWKPFNTEENYCELEELKHEKVGEIDPDTLRPIHQEYVMNLD
ncbi:hypothetical protein KR044_011249 [Drosophila immigrans]|nr:hypothetical protein KR044_011249 [Drosophila immigrans]